MPIPDGLLAPPATIDFKQAIADAVASIVPEGKTTAFIATADMTAVHFGFASRVNDHWEIAATADQPWHGAFSGPVKVLASW